MMAVIARLWDACLLFAKFRRRQVPSRSETINSRTVYQSSAQGLRALTSNARLRFVVLLESISDDSNLHQPEGNLMARKLDGKKVAILVTDGFEQVEMTKPREALDEAGAETKIVALRSVKIQGMNHADKGDKFDVDLTLDEARPEEFDALMIPGGVFNR